MICTLNISGLSVEITMTIYIFKLSSLIKLTVFVKTMRRYMATREIIMKFLKKTAVKNNKINETGPVISIRKDINENITRLENDFGHDSDLVVHYFKFDNSRGLICANIY